jgi:outer membrane receptor for ferrienterochelin and colicins
MRTIIISLNLNASSNGEVTVALCDKKRSPIRHKKLAIGVQLALGITGYSAIANAAEEDNIHLSPVVVTASGYEQEAVSAPASISVIDSEQLEKGSYTDLTDALRDVPGLIITGGGAGDNGVDISLRGMPANYTLLMIDGKRVGSRESRPNGNAGYETDWFPPLDAIERIEVVRGPMSTLYGSDAIGGVINVITKKNQPEWHGSLQQEVTFQENDDSGDSNQTSFNLAGPLIKDKLGLQLYGRQYNRNEDKILNGYEDKGLQSLSSKLTFTPSEDHDFIFEAGRTNQHRYSTMGKSAATEGCRGGCTDSETKTTRSSFAVSHTGRWSFGTTDTHIQRESTNNKARDIRITNTLAKSTLNIPLDNQTVTLGVNYEHEELNDKTTNQISDRTFVENTQYAIFAEDEWYITDNFSLTSGIRLDDSENYDSHVSPRLYGVYMLADEWTVKGGVSTGYRAPGLRETTADWGQTSRGGDVYGNPDLKPETSVSKEIGLYYQGYNDISASFTVFHNDFKDKITRIACPDTICTDGPNSFGSDPTYRINVDEATTQGIEASFSQQVTSNINVNASYTYTDSEQKSGEYKGEPLTQLPKHMFNLGVNWENSDKLNSWAQLTYRGKESQPTTGPSTSAIVAPSSTMMDVGLNYSFTPSLMFKAGIYNLFDKEIDYDEYGYVEDGRRYWMALNYQF